MQMRTHHSWLGDCETYNEVRISVGSFAVLAMGRRRCLYETLRSSALQQWQPAGHAVGAGFGAAALRLEPSACRRCIHHESHSAGIGQHTMSNEQACRADAWSEHL